MSYVFPSVTINYITYTAKRWGQFPQIQYAVASPVISAGQEYVTIAPDLSKITVTIASGTSTNAQIVAALSARGISTDSLYPSDLVDFAITSGHASDTNTIVSATSMTGALNTVTDNVGFLTFTDIHADIGTTSPTEATIIATPAESGLFMLSFYGTTTVAASGADAAPNLYMAWTDDGGVQKYFNFAGNLDITHSDGPNNVALPIYCLAHTPVWMYTAGGNYTGTARWSFRFAVKKI